MLERVQTLAKRAGDLARRAGVALGAVSRRQAATLLGLSLVAAAVAQYMLDHGEVTRTVAALFALAVFLFVLVTRRVDTEDEEHPLAATRPKVPWALVGVAMALGAVAFPRFTGNVFSPAGTWLWLAGGVLLAIACWRGQQPSAVDASQDEGADENTVGLSRGLQVYWYHLVLLSIMLIGAFYRFYRIDEIPQEMGCDLPHIYNNIRMILRKEFLIFFPSHPGREGLFFYLAAPFCRLFGLNHTTIKMSAAIVGVLTLPVIYALGKELFNREVGLYAAFWMSISHWHIILTRVGFRACTVPLLLALVWLFLVRGLDRGRPADFALAGLFLGLGLYSYNAWMIVPLMVVLFYGTLLVTGRARRFWRNLPNFVMLVVVSVYVFIPLARYAYEEPKMYGYRAATRVTSLESALPEDIVKVFFSNTTKALLMFNVQGDSVFIANVPHLRQLSFGAATLFVLGAAYLLWRWRRGYNLTVFVSLGVMLLPTILALAFPHEVPNAIRAIGALPAAMLLPAVAMAAIRGRVAQIYPARPSREMRLVLAENGASRLNVAWRWGWTPRHNWIVLLIVVLVLETQAVYSVYFDDYRINLPDKNYAISMKMAEAIDEFSDDGESYIKIMPFWYDGNAVRAQLRVQDQSWHNELMNLDANQPPFVGGPGKFMVIVHPQDADALRLLRQAFPRGLELRHPNNDGQTAFITFYGER